MSVAAFGRAPKLIRGRALTAAGLLVIAGLLVGFLHVFQGIEALIATHLFSAGTPTSADFHHAVVFFGLGQPGGFGLQITPECSSALLIVPLALVAIGLLTRPQVRWQRVLLAFTVASLVLIASNQLRLGVIAWAVSKFGLQTGFQWSHVVVGSVISLVFAVCALALLFWIAARDREKEAAHGA